MNTQNEKKWFIGNGAPEPDLQRLRIGKIFTLNKGLTNLFHPAVNPEIVDMNSLISLIGI